MQITTRETNPNKLQGPYMPQLQELGFRVGFKRRGGRRRRRLGVGFRGAITTRETNPNKLQGPYMPLLQELGFRVGFKEEEEEEEEEED